MIFQIIALSVLAVFYGCYFVKMISQRKKGIRTDQIGKDKTGSVMVIETAMKIAAYLVPIAEVISIAAETSCLPDRLRAAGAAIAACGVMIFILAVFTMRDSWRAGVSKTDKTELVTGGIYQISRNPAFLGFDLVYIGILCMFFNWVLLVVSVFAVFMFHLQIVYVEEDYLNASFGESYLEYKKRVCRYLGRYGCRRQRLLKRAGGHKNFVVL